MKADQIPPEVVEAFRKAWLDGSLTVEAAIAAGLAAWPRMHLDYVSDSVKMRHRIILPLKEQET